MKMKAREWKKAWEEVQEFDSSYAPSRFLEPATVLVFFRRFRHAWGVLTGKHDVISWD